MSIPVATGSFTVQRKEHTSDPDSPADVDPWSDGYDEDADQTPDSTTEWLDVATDVRGTLGAPTGRQISGGTRIEYPLALDPCSLKAGDRVKDERTGRAYGVTWCVDTPGVVGLLASVQAGVYEITGTGEEEAQ